MKTTTCECRYNEPRTETKTKTTCAAFEDKLHDARVDARKIAASLERQHEATLGAIEVLANRVVPLLNSLAGVQSRQRARAEEQLEQIDELLAELEKAGGR